MSGDYFRFIYQYNLMVEDNSEGIEWKLLRVCTETKVLFDKYKVIQYFNVSEEYSKYDQRMTELYNKEISDIYQNNQKKKLNITSKYRVNVEKFLKSKPKYYMFPEIWKMFRIGKFFLQFFERFFDQTNFIELSSMVVNDNELFECSAKFHYKNSSIDSNAMEIENCFENFQIKTTVIANNTFGVCYEFYDKNLSIILKDDDFIKLKIKFKKQEDFIVILSQKQ